jgi:hypothetical protein
MVFSLLFDCYPDKPERGVAGKTTGYAAEAPEKVRVK